MVLSLIDQLVDPGVVPLSHVVDNFPGDTLDERWNFTDVVGTGSGAMNDAENGGYQITTGATDDNESSINFNNIRHYSNTNAIFIATVKRDATGRMRVGFSEDTIMGNSMAMIQNDFDATFYEIVSDDGTTETTTAGTTAVDTSFHMNELRINTNLLMYIDGTLEALKTNNLPDATQQPYFSVKARSAGAKTGNIRYYEAYNQ